MILEQFYLVNLLLSGRFAEFAAAVHAPKQEVVLIGSAAEVHEARPRLARVGIDGVVGAVTDLHALSEHPELVSTQSSSPRGRRRRGSSR
jgi:hydroxyacylglutathione hydrolase